ncbi:MAG: ABC transporter substrate-binding protein [Ktedonobacteraceae bacterium]|nr:ABC transporter substrate-binding protein [Ktedonobacteraceae bacterium]
MHLSFRRPVLLLACLLLVGLSIASCGGSTTPNPTTSMTLKVGTITDAIPFFPFYVAREKNFFKAQGLTLDPAVPLALGSGAKLATTLEANGIEVAVGTVTDAFNVSRIDTSIRLIGAVSNDFLLDIVVRKDFAQQAHLTPTSSLADKVKALVGKKIGISAPGSSTDALITYLFRQQGLDAQKDAIKVSVGAATVTDLAALQAGRIDATVVGAPGGEIAEAQGLGDILISPTRGDVPSMQGQLFGLAYIKQQVIDSKLPAVQAFIRALAQADTFIQNNPDQALPLLEKYLHLNAKTAASAWNATKASMPQTPQISQTAYDTANQFQVKAGLLAIALPYKDLVASDTINKALSTSPSS